MSTNAHAAAHGSHADGSHGSHDAHHDHDHDDIGYHATTGGYLVGFALSVILTAIPFWLVMTKVLPNSWTVPIILAFAGVQMIVHMIYFLHMNAKVEGGWSMLAMLFTIGIVVIMMAGSIWVMYHMNANMMPMPDAQTMRNMP